MAGPEVAGQDAPRPRSRDQVRELLTEQSRIQWVSIGLTWVVVMVVFWLLERFVLQSFGLPFLLLVATATVLVEVFRQRRRGQRISHALDAELVLVRITDLAPREMTVSGLQGPVRLPVSSTSGLDVGDRIWAVPPPRPGVEVVLVRHEARPGPGSIDLILPRGNAESA